jgi:hypothetical protein
MRQSRYWPVSTRAECLANVAGVSIQEVRYQNYFHNPTDFSLVPKNCLPKS